MSLAPVATAYVERLIDPNGNPRILLLDSETTAVLSLAATQSALLKNGVFLIDKVANPSRQKMRHLDCTVFVRPSSESIQAIIDELRVPRYAKYTLVFTNVVRKSQLERLAEADDHEVVVRVQEMFLDWRKINGDLFACGELGVWAPGASGPTAWDTLALERSCDALFALLGSLRAGHAAIRYDANSGLSKRLASQLDAELKQHSAALPAPVAAPGVGNGSTVLLVLDRFNDPLTPLLSHWTYQAMVDELVGIDNNLVDLSRAPDVPASHREIVLAQDQDSFFNDAMFLNFGDLGAAVREYVQHYSTRTKTSEQLETVADIKKFVDGLPEFRKLQSNTTKHVSLVGELSRLVAECHLLAVSEVEQSLACNENHASDLQSIKQLLVADGVPLQLKYRLVALYGLRYRNHAQAATEQLLQMLRAGSTTDVGLDRGVRNLLNVYGPASRFPQEDLFSQGSIFTRAQQGLKGLRGVENVYTQHKALLESVLAQLTRNRLPRDKYPFISRTAEEPSTIVVFIAGGVTFEEARIVGEYNRTNPPQRVVLGGTGVVNPQRFLNALSEYTWA